MAEASRGSCTCLGVLTDIFERSPHTDSCSWPHASFSFQHHVGQSYCLRINSCCLPDIHRPPSPWQLPWLVLSENGTIAHVLRLERCPIANRPRPALLERYPRRARHRRNGRLSVPPVLSTRLV